MRKQTLTWLSLLLVLAVSLTACGTAAPEATAAPASDATEIAATESAPTEEPLSGTLSISGAFALYPMMTIWAEEFTKLHPDVQFDVQDSGPGVPAAERDRIFDAFQQLDGSFSRRHGGTGLGLTISRDLARAMGGTLECLDAPGGGALFRLVLPLQRAHAEPDRAERHGARPESASRPGREDAALAGRVLLVEDNPVNALVAEAALARLGVEFETVGNGVAAVSLATRERWDLILMDCQMPELDGFEATTRIRRHEQVAGLPAVPIVALTANAMDGDRERSLAAGMDDHLAKPFRGTTLLQTVSAAIDAPRPS